MNRCPSCRNLVPAGWIACRRCGAALTVERPGPPNDNALPRRSSLPVTARSATLTRPAAAAPPSSFTPTRDTLLPGSNDDTLVSATARSRSRTSRRTQIVVACIAAGAVALVVWTIVHATHNGGASGTDPRLHAETIVRHAAAAAAPAYGLRGSFVSVSPSSLAHASGLHVVNDETPAPAEGVSIKIAAPTKLIIATPVSNEACVFGQDDAGVVTFAFTASRQCRAASAPREGWVSG